MRGQIKAPLYMQGAFIVIRIGPVFGGMTIIGGNEYV